MREDVSTVGAADFVSDRVGRLRFDAIESVAEDVCFGMATVLHADQGHWGIAVDLMNSVCPPG